MLPALAFVIAASSAVYVLRQNDYFWRNPLDRARIEQVTDFEGDELDADLSRDGKWMTFLSDRGGRFNAWVGQIASGNFVNVTKGRFPTLEPAPIHRVGFAADGAHVWFLGGNGKSMPYQTWLASGTRGTPQPKTFHFRAPPAAFTALRDAGIDLVTMANNHALDYGPVGLADTLAAARAARFPYVGIGASAAAAWAPYVTTVKGVKIAVIGVSQVVELASSWVATPRRPGEANAIDLGRTLAAVRSARP